MRLSKLQFKFIPRSFVLPALGATIVLLIISGALLYQYQTGKINDLSQRESALTQKLTSVQTELEKIKNEDQVKRNDALQGEIENIQKNYNGAVTSYESLLELKTKSKNTDVLDKLLAQTLSYLAGKNYSSASATLISLNSKIQEENKKIASSFSIPANVTASNTAPSSGFGKQRVNTEIGEFLVDIVSADIASTRVIVDTASDSDCRDNCPVLSLGDYVSRNGAFAGINGSYFCPASYPTCVGKANSFDTLAMNKNKIYFNSDNNVYSNVPVVIFGSGYVRFVGSSSGWGRDTGVDGVIANQPLLLSGGNIAFGGDGDPKKGSRGTRSFVGVGDGKVYIGVVHNATVAEVAYALKALGMTDALNLDSGGSTALWNGGYKVGPGRNIPNAILFVRR